MKNYINHVWMEHRSGIEHAAVVVFAMTVLYFALSWITGIWWGWREALIPLAGVLFAVVNFIIVPAMYTYDSDTDYSRS